MSGQGMGFFLGSYLGGRISCYGGLTCPRSAAPSTASEKTVFAPPRGRIALSTAGGKTSLIPKPMMRMGGWARSSARWQHLAAWLVAHLSCNHFAASCELQRSPGRRQEVRSHAEEERVQRKVRERERPGPEDLAPISGPSHVTRISARSPLQPGPEDLAPISGPTFVIPRSPRSQMQPGPEDIAPISVPGAILSA